MKNLIHITIGIPVFNEEANIAKLLNALFKQNNRNFVLDKIIVVCDGSTDGTVNIVKRLTKRYSRLRCRYDGVRRGVTYRTQELISLNKSDILVFFDGDTMPENEDTLENLAGVFDDKAVKLATAALIPVKPTTRFEYVLFAWRSIWTRLTHNWKNGNNIYNFRGVGLALRRDFARSIRLPKEITGASSHFIYLSAAKKSLKTAFCKSAVINYRLAATMGDYLLQLNRGSSDSAILKALFPKIYNLEYTIPRTARIYNIIKNMIYIPVGSIVGMTFHILIPFFNKHASPSDQNGIWKSANSTKTLA